MSELCWGIIGLGGIAEKLANLKAFDHGGRLQAVAARDLDRAKQFAEKHKVPLYFGSYDEILNHPEVNAIYLAIPTRFKHALTLQAAKNKKHVLVEKPMSSTALEALEMINVCKENNVVLLDGTQFASNLRTLEIKKRIEAGDLGEVIHCSYDFTNVMPRPNIRYDTKLEPGGALGDLGWYCIRGIDVMMGPEWPTKVWATYDFLEENKAISSMTCVMEWKEGKTARFHCSFREPRRQFLVVSGTKLGLSVEAMVRPRAAPGPPTYEEVTIAGDWSTVTVPLPDNTKEWYQEHAMLANFAKMVKDRSFGKEWMEASFMTQCVMDAACSSADQGGVWVKVERPVV